MPLMRARARKPAASASDTRFEIVMVKRSLAAAYAIQIGNNKGPGYPGPLMHARNSRLFQRVVDGGELGVQVGTEAVDHSDDRERNASCNQAVFDGGGAGLILHETSNKVLHR